MQKIEWRKLDFFAFLAAAALGQNNFNLLAAVTFFGNTGYCWTNKQKDSVFVYENTKSDDEMPKLES